MPSGLVGSGIVKQFSQTPGEVSQQNRRPTGAPKPSTSKHVTVGDWQIICSMQVPFWQVAFGRQTVPSGRGESRLFRSQSSQSGSHRPGSGKQVPPSQIPHAPAQSAPSFAGSQVMFGPEQTWHTDPQRWSSGWQVPLRQAPHSAPQSAVSGAGWQAPPWQVRQTPHESPAGAETHVREPASQTSHSELHRVSSGWHRPPWQVAHRLHGIPSRKVRQAKNVESQNVHRCSPTPQIVLSGKH